MKLSRKLKLKASRIFEKSLTSYQNIYGYEHHKNSLSEGIAGVHISFTFTMYTYFETKSVSYYGMWDWVQLFKHLDEKFKGEIKAAKRVPGMYELKPDGRIEYRSLPANVDLMKVIEVIKEWKF